MEKLISPPSTARFVILPAGEDDLVKLMEVLPSKLYFPVTIALSVTILNESSDLNIISVKSQALTFIYSPFF
tara:strand:- start:345 stop:560 length:216 start_codon:yes stop_codon:yes gene_type:complete